MNSPAAHFPLFDAGGLLAPAAPAAIQDTGIEREVLLALLLKICYTASQTTTEAAASRMLLPIPLIAEMLEELRRDNLVEILGSSGPIGFRFTFASAWSFDIPPFVYRATRTSSKSSSPSPSWSCSSMRDNMKALGRYSFIISSISSRMSWRSVLAVFDILGL